MQTQAKVSQFIIFSWLIIILFSQQSSISLDPSIIKVRVDEGQIHLLSKLSNNQLDVERFNAQLKPLKFLAQKGNTQAQDLLYSWALTHERPKLAEQTLIDAIKSGRNDLLGKLIHFYRDKQDWQAILALQNSLFSQQPKLIIEAKMFLGEQLSQAEITRFKEMNKSLFFSDLKNVLKPAKCQLLIQPVVGDAHSLSRLSQIIEILKRNAEFKQLSICFNDLVYMPKRLLDCPEKPSNSALLCQFKAEANQVQYWSSEIDHLVVMAQSGKANANNGVIFLDQMDTDKVLFHEIMHLIGFVDEYMLTASKQSAVCRKRISPYDAVNISLNQLGELIHPGLLDTCVGTDWQAVRKSTQLNLMQYLDKPLSEEYLVIAKANLFQAKRAFPSFDKFMSTSQTISVMSQQWNERLIARGYYQTKLEITEQLLEQQQFKQAQQIFTNYAEFPSSHVGHARALMGLKNYEAANKLLRLGHQQKNLYATYFLARNFERGKGVKLNLSKALSLYEYAGNLNNPLALYKWAEVGLKMDKLDREEAIRLYQLASELGHPLAHNAKKQLLL